MPKSRQHPALVRTFGITTHQPLKVAWPVAGWDQLILSTQGVVSVHTAAGLWILPAHRALWVPDGVTHTLATGPHATLSILYFRARQARRLPRACAAVNVSPLLRELVLACVRLGALSPRRPAHRRLAAVVLDQLETLPTAPLHLPEPHDPRARRLATLLRAQPQLSLAHAAATTGTALRTLERLFRAETGLPLGTWLRRLRLSLALAELAAGATVTAAAQHCGYGPSAFVSMFRRELGLTPGRFSQIR